MNAATLLLLVACEVVLTNVTVSSIVQNSTGPLLIAKGEFELQLM